MYLYIDTDMDVQGLRFRVSGPEGPSPNNLEVGNILITQFLGNCTINRYLEPQGYRRICKFSRL